MRPATPARATATAAAAPARATTAAAARATTAAAAAAATTRPAPGDRDNPRSNRGPAAAAENRAALIRAANEVFAERGLDAPLNAIAQRAGVGQGVLYRHFPTRESLAIEAFEGNVTEIEDAVKAGGTLADVLRMVSEQAASSVSFIALVSRHPNDPRALALASRVAALIDRTLESGRAAGTVPAGYGRDDVLLAIRLTAGVLSTSQPGERDQLISSAWQLLGIRLG